jgi:hypothetical protein
MPPSIPTLRTLALLALLVVGLACSFAFHAAVADMQVSYTATAVDPDENPALVAHASGNVTDLDGRLRGESSSVRKPVHRAAETGSFEGDVPPELDITIDDVDTPYVVYGGSYYRWNLTANETTTFVRIQMTPADGTSVVADVSSPYDSASPDVQRAIDSGSVTEGNVERGIYRHGETYYAVAPESDTAIAEKLLGGLLGYVLTPVGRGYVAVALGLLAVRYRDPLRKRPLTVRRALAVASLAIPIALVGTALFESGSASRFVTGPSSSLVVASGVVAGALTHRRRWVPLLGFTAVVAVAAIGGGVLALGVFGAIVGGVTLVAGLVAGVVPFVYGLAFASDRPEATNDATDVRDAER